MASARGSKSVPNLLLHHAAEPHGLQEQCTEQGHTEWLDGKLAQLFTSASLTDLSSFTGDPSEDLPVEEVGTGEVTLGEAASECTGDMAMDVHSFSSPFPSLLERMGAAGLKDGIVKEPLKLAVGCPQTSTCASFTDLSTIIKGLGDLLFCDTASGSIDFWDAEEEAAGAEASRDKEAPDTAEKAAPLPTFMECVGSGAHSLDVALVGVLLGSLWRAVLHTEHTAGAPRASARSGHAVSNHGSWQSLARPIPHAPLGAVSGAPASGLLSKGGAAGGLRRVGRQWDLQAFHSAA